MDINNIPKTRINNVEQQNVSQTQKAKDTTFRTEKGPELLGVRGDSRHALLPTPKTDFGVKTGKLSFDEEQEDALTKANISSKNRSIRSKVYRLLEKGLNINDAIACVFSGFGLDEIKTFQNLGEKSSDLDSEDKIGIIIYGLEEDIQRYGEIKEKYTQSGQQGNSKLEKYEMLLATKLNLEDDEIKRYIEIKNNENLSSHFSVMAPDDWMACVKAKFEGNDFARFAQLKRRKISFKKMTVRGQGDVQIHPTEKIIRYINTEKAVKKNLKLGRLEYSLIKKFLEENVQDVLVISRQKTDESENEDYNEKLETIKEYFKHKNGESKEKALNAAAPMIQNFLEELPEDFWYMTSMSADKDARSIIKDAVKAILETSSGGPDIPLLEAKEISSALGEFAGRYKYKNGIFTINKSQSTQGQNSEPFEVKLTKGYVNNKPVLVIEDENSSNKYIAYNGAIVKVKESRTNNSEQFKAWANLLPEEQAKVLAEAANEFPFDLFDENGHCIIGQNISDKDIKNMKENEIEKFYGEEFCKLKKNNELTPQNILKLMPKDCMLSVSPYIEDKELLYAVVAEWFSKDENGNEHKWQLEIHSPNIKHNDDEKWVFRLHKDLGKEEETEQKDTNPETKEAGKNRRYFQFVDEGYNFEGVYTGEGCEASHVPISSPFEEKDLLNNLEFQKSMRLISTKLCDNLSISSIAAELGIKPSDPTEATMQKIVDHCLHNVSDFAKYKDEVLKMRAALGCCDLS